MKKKILVTILALVLSLSMFACNSTADLENALKATDIDNYTIVLEITFESEDEEEPMVMSQSMDIDGDNVYNYDIDTPYGEADNYYQYKRDGKMYKLYDNDGVWAESEEEDFSDNDMLNLKAEDFDAKSDGWYHLKSSKLSSIMESISFAGGEEFQAIAEMMTTKYFRVRVVSGKIAEVALQLSIVEEGEDGADGFSMTATIKATYSNVGSVTVTVPTVGSAVDA